MALMTFPLPIDAFNDRVAPVVRTYTQNEEGGRDDAEASGDEVACAMQPSGIDAKAFYALQQIGLDANYLAKFMFDPEPLGIVVDAEVIQTVSGGRTLADPKHFAVVAVQDDGIGICWTAYFKYRG